MRVISLPVGQIKVGDRLRSLDPDKVVELAESIDKIGLINPITVTPENNLLSGYHRLEATKLLKSATIDCQVVELDESRSRLVELDENLKRHELNDIEIGEHLLARDEILAQLGYSRRPGRRSNSYTELPTLQDLADEMTVSLDTIVKKKRIAKNLSYPVKEKLRNTPFASQTRALLKLAQIEDHEIQNQVVDSLLAGRYPTLAEAVKEGKVEVKKRDVMKSLKQIKINHDSSLILHHGDFRSTNGNLAENSVDLIFTDPPYAKEHIGLYEDLSLFASKVLKPGGSCLAYAGHYFLPQVLAAMSTHLNYWWTIAVTFNVHRAIQKRGIYVEWKPILWFVKGSRPIETDFVLDSVQSEKPELKKVLHPWEQSPVEAKYYIHYLSPVGGLVCDPMMGTGTTAISALNCGRRFIGFEIDPETHSMARLRLNKALSTMQD